MGIMCVGEREKSKVWKRNMEEALNEEMGRWRLMWFLQGPIEK
jgi:hypothetical protein